jgi:non-canonical purine NTP pyrophosphatase (RdgB/HAM1 family)
VKDLVFITGNTNKVLYLSKWLGIELDHQKIDLDEIQSLNLREVAEHKARHAYEIVGKPVLIEDVGMRFNAIDPLPGPFIKWFNQPGMPALCKMLDGFDDRHAIAEIVYVVFDGKDCAFFDGKMTGVISPSPRGTGGFGFDSIFINDGYEITRAEMTEELYADTSYRKQAITSLREFLRKNT